MNINRRSLLASLYRSIAIAAAAAVTVVLSLPPRGALADDAKLTDISSPGTTSSSSKSSDDSQVYKVQIMRPMKPGERMHMKRDIEMSATETTEQDGQPGGSESRSSQIHFSGMLEVAAVAKHGVPVKWKVTAGTATMSGNGTGGSNSLLTPKTNFILTFSGGKAIVADYDSAHPLSSDAKKYLPIVFNATGGRGESSLAEIIDNPSAPRTGNWNLNAKAIATALKGFDSTLAAPAVSGTAHIKSVVGDGAKAALAVEYQFTVNSKKPNNPPAGSTPIGATLTGSGTVIVPVNGATSYLSGKMVIHTSGTFKKTAKNHEENRTGRRVVNKTVDVQDEAMINAVETVNTLITYGDGPDQKKTSPFDGTHHESTSSSSKSTATSSASDAGGQ